MSIWTIKPTLDQVNSLLKGTMVEHLGIEMTEIGDDFLKGKMPVDSRTQQVYGIMHGGASCVLAESIGSLGSGLCVDRTLYQCVGIEINTSHIKSVNSGWVIATAKPLHRGKTTHVWEIPIEDEHGRLVSMSRLRVAIIEKRF